MTSRERWILYPLLILALGIAWRDKVVPRTVPLRADRIICNRLEVAGHRGRDAIRLEAVSGNGQIRIYGRNGEGVVLGPGDWLSRKPPAKVPSVREEPASENWPDRLGRYWSMLDEWIEAELPPEPPAPNPEPPVPIPQSAVPSP